MTAIPLRVLPCLALVAGCGDLPPSGPASSDTETASPVGSSSAETAPAMDSTGSAESAAGGDATGLADESSGDGPMMASRCEQYDGVLLCEHHTTTLFTGLTGLLPRQVHWQVPLGRPPEAGWPAALLFQGSLFTAETFWTVLDLDTLGYRNQGRLTQGLLDSGFAVITPEAHAGGFTAWDTNIPPMSQFWETAEDHWFMLDIFDELDAGGFGPIDATRLFAAGISSGGYMTSRMDQAYRTRFVALAIQSASWATCAGPICNVPALDAGHLPTMFLHGSDDAIVPLATMELYRDALDGVGVETETIVAPRVGHAWIDEAPDAIVSWFAAH